MLVANKYHVTYCTNIHPGKDWKLSFEQLKQYLPQIKQELSPDNNFGIGLRLSNLASEELEHASNLEEFKNWLSENGLYVFTMNGFPYGNFHDERVKDQVHAPDWTTKERLVYTQRLFQQLAYLIPDGISGGISTSPISYRHWHTTKADIDKAFLSGADNLVAVLPTLWELENSTGKYLHLDIEPEPDGLLENSREVILFFENYLIPRAVETLTSQLGISALKARELTLRYITVCYDVCHFSLAYEDPKDTLAAFAQRGIKVGKIQISAALKIIFNAQNKEEIWESLARFDESTYLHQVTEQVEGRVKTYNDLPAVLEQKKDFSEIRAHFHVPIFLEKFDKLYATQDQILNVLSYLKKNNVSEHLEVETYTWSVLPKNLKMNLSQSIIREMHWLISKL